jgi:hypothetical protein
MALPRRLRNLHSALFRTKRGHRVRAGPAGAGGDMMLQVETTKHVLLCLRGRFAAQIKAG